MALERGLSIAGRFRAPVQERATINGFPLRRTGATGDRLSLSGSISHRLGGESSIASTVRRLGPEPTPPLATHPVRNSTRRRPFNQG